MKTTDNNEIIKKTQEDAEKFYAGGAYCGEAVLLALKCIGLSGEMHEWFKEANGKNSTCCRVLRHKSLGNTEFRAFFMASVLGTAGYS